MSTIGEMIKKRRKILNFTFGRKCPVDEPIACTISTAELTSFLTLATFFCRGPMANFNFSYIASKR